MSRLRLSSVTVHPPPDIRISWVKSPVPCISGQAGRPIVPGPCTASRTSCRSASVCANRRQEGADERSEQVVLAPHHALGHAGRAAGVQEEQVVAVAAPLAPHRFRRSRFGGGLVGRGPLRARAAAVVDPSHSLIRGRRPRMPSMRSANAPWNTTATTSPLTDVHDSSTLRPVVVSSQQPWSQAAR